MQYDRVMESRDVMKMSCAIRHHARKNGASAQVDSTVRQAGDRKSERRCGRDARGSGAKSDRYARQRGGRC